MKKALAGVLAVALAGLMASAATAQVPNVQVYFDNAFTQAQADPDCPGAPGAGPPVELYVVLNNFNMEITAADFSIAYPPSMAWVGDQSPLADASLTSIIGASPSGVAIAWANCCSQDGFQPVLALRPLVIWLECACNGGPQSLVVGGYAPLAKVNPTVVRKSDFQEFEGVGMTSLVCPGVIATEQSTWGQVKALYR